MEPLKELLSGITRQATPVQGVGEAVAPYSEPSIQMIQQLLQLIMGQGQQDPNAGMINDPISGGPMSRSPLKNRLVGPSADPSMGMGY